MIGPGESYAADAILTFHALARPSIDYCKANGVDWTATQPASGGIYLAPVRVVGAAQFDFDVDGKIVAVVCPVLDRDGCGVIDMACWLPDRPDRVRTLFGLAPALGLQAAESPFTYFGDRPLHLYRTPLNWLRSGCDGACWLDDRRGARWSLDLPTSAFAAEDDTHAAAITRARQALVDGQSVFVSLRSSNEEAA